MCVLWSGELTQLESFLGPFFSGGKCNKIYRSIVVSGLRSPDLIGTETEHGTAN